MLMDKKKPMQTTWDSELGCWRIFNNPNELHPKKEDSIPLLPEPDELIKYMQHHLKIKERSWNWIWRKITEIPEIYHYIKNKVSKTQQDVEQLSGLNPNNAIESFNAFKSILINIDILEQIINSNPTYQKFNQKQLHNTYAGLSKATQVYPSESYIWSKYFSAGFLIVGAMFAGISNYLRLSETEPSKEDENDYDDYKSYMEKLNIVYMTSICVSTFATLTLFYNYISEDKEKLEKELYDGQRKLMDRLIPIQNEIHEKERIYARLVDHFSFDDTINENNEEENRINLRDLILTALDSKNDLAVYNRVENALKIMEPIAKKGAVSFFYKRNRVKQNFDKIILDLLKINIIRKYYAGGKKAKKAYTLLIKINSINELINSVISLPSIPDFDSSKINKKVIIDQLVVILDNKDKLIAIHDLYQLTQQFNEFNIELNYCNLDQSPLMVLNDILTVDYYKLPHKLTQIHENLNSLDEKQRKILIENINDSFVNQAKLYETEIDENNASTDTEIIEKNVKILIAHVIDTDVEEIKYKQEVRSKINDLALKVNAAGSDETLATHGEARNYWYSMLDGFLLLIDIRSKKLIYTKNGPEIDQAKEEKGKEKAELTEYPCNQGEEYSCFRENQNGIFIANPYFTESFSSHLTDDIDRITGKSPQQPWENMPELLIFPTITVSYHWRAIRVKIDYENRKVSILWDDPKGSGNFGEKLRENLLPIIKRNILKLFKNKFAKHNAGIEETSSDEELNENNITFTTENKKLKQQSQDNGCDCGPIIFSNIRDYTNKQKSNNSFAKAKKPTYTLRSKKGAPAFEAQLITIRQTDKNIYLGTANSLQDNNFIYENNKRIYKEAFKETFRINSDDPDLKRVIEKISLLEARWISEIFKQVEKLPSDSSEKFTTENLERAYKNTLKKIRQQEYHSPSPSIKQKHDETSAIDSAETEEKNTNAFRIVKL